MASQIHENVKNYYGSRLKTSEDLQTSAACAAQARPLLRGPRQALELVHPDVRERYFGCGLVIPQKLQACKVLDLGSGSGRDCFILSKLVGKEGHVTGIDMTEEMILASQKFITYHQEKFGYEKPNTVFVQGYMEKLEDAGLQSNSLDVVVSNCVVCLCPDKRAVLREAHRVLKEGGELYFSDMYASQAVPESFKDDPVLWGEGMAGALYWRDLISLAQEIGFSTHLVAGTRIVVHNPELKKKAGGVQYASGTFRLFKLPKPSLMRKALVTYTGAVPDCEEQLDFDSEHSFKKDVAVEVGGEMAAVLQHSRFSADFNVQLLDEPDPALNVSPQLCHLSPFLLADRLGVSMQQCSKTAPPGGCC